jgi:hypothetical protein
MEKCFTYIYIYILFFIKIRDLIYIIFLFFFSPFIFFLNYHQIYEEAVKIHNNFKNESFVRKFW